MSGPREDCPPPTNRGAENPLAVSVDWVEFSTWNANQEEAERVLLGYVEGEFVEVDNGMLGYECQRVGPGAARILWSARRPEVHVVLPGGWCGATSEAGMRGLLAYVCATGRATRVDLAADDWARRAQPEQVRDALQRGEGVTHTRSRHWYQDLATGGGTLYVGAASSRQRLRVYDKTVESGGGIVAVRWEVQARAEAAQTLPGDLAMGNWGTIWASRVVQLIDFCDGRQTDRPGRCPRSEWFSGLVGDAAKARVYDPKPPRTVEEVKAWIDKQVAPSLAAVVAASGGDMDYMSHLVLTGRSRWKGKHRALLASAAGGPGEAYDTGQDASSGQGKSV